MREWVRKAGRSILAAAEVGVASFLLLTALTLQDVRTGVEAGTYDPEAASSFAIGFLLLWAVTCFGLLVLLAGHVAAWALSSPENHGEVRSGAVRVVVELLVALVLFVLAGGGVPAGGYEFLLDVSVVVSLGVLVHVAVNATRFVRNVVAS